MAAESRLTGKMDDHIMVIGKRLTGEIKDNF